MSLPNLIQSVRKTPRRVRIAQASIAGVALGLLVAGSLPSQSYTKDLQQEYLSAWALRDGIDPFTPTAELSARYFPSSTTNFPHPNPHPPVLALIALPLTLLPFPLVVALWLGLNIALLVAIGRWLGLSLQQTLPLAAWPPMWCLLYIGQFELLILAVLLLGWRAAASGRDWRAGWWLGSAAAIKLYPVLVLVPFLARRRVRVLLAAGAVLSSAQVGNLIAVGPAGLVRYYREVVPAVSARYATTGLNSSPYGALLRVFGGATDVAPLIHASGIVWPVTLALSLLALVALAKLEPEAAPVAVLVALPAVWYYHVVLALPQMVTLLRTSRLHRATLVACAAASFALPLVNLILTVLGKLPTFSGEGPLGIAVLTAIQPAGLVALLLLSLTSQRQPRTT